jgi:hypothetical protein
MRRGVAAQRDGDVTGHRDAPGGGEGGAQDESRGADAPQRRARPAVGTERGHADLPGREVAAGLRDRPALPAQREGDRPVARRGEGSADRPPGGEAAEPDLARPAAV